MRCPGLDFATEKKTRFCANQFDPKIKMNERGEEREGRGTRGRGTRGREREERGEGRERRGDFATKKISFLCK